MSLSINYDGWMDGWMYILNIGSIRTYYRTFIVRIYFWGVCGPLSWTKKPELIKFAK